MTKIELTHQGFQLTKEIKQYVNKKIGKLDRYIKRTKRRSIRAEVKLREEKGKKKNKCTAEVILHLPDTRLAAEESTVNVYAAIDIVEAKLSNQLRKHKDKKSSHRTDRKGVFRKLRRMTDRDFRGRQN